MCLLVIKGFALLLLCISCHAAPLADNVRKALVIGNDAYVTSRLKNAVNDAEDMARVLRGLGFGVTVITNATGAGMEEAVSVFIGHLSPGDRVVVFYAGHGVQDGVENYMIPIDFTPTAVRQIRMQAYPLSRLQHLLSHAAPSLQVMIFDACRDNPFHEQLSLKRGWRMVDNTTASPNVDVGGSSKARLRAGPTPAIAMASYRTA